MTAVVTLQMLSTIFLCGAFIIGLQFHIRMLPIEGLNMNISRKSDVTQHEQHGQKSG